MPGWDPQPSSIRISRMLNTHIPRPQVAFHPMVTSPRPPPLRRADGGVIPDSPFLPHVGAINTSTPGRADADPMHVPPGSYVIPAEIVSHLGEGNTAAGLKMLTAMFLPAQRQAMGALPLMGTAPYGASGAPYGAASPRLARGPGPPRGIEPRISGLPSFTVAAGPLGQTSPVFHQGAHGGVVPGEPGGAFLGRMGVGQQRGTPINASGGEFVVPPEEVKRRGRGDIQHGHEILDAWVRHLHQEHIKTLKKLPGPAQ
jgi:hypothetical protein